MDKAGFCARYDGSYSNLVGTSFGDIDFTYSPCSGALIKGATKQAKALSSDQDFIIISAVRDSFCMHGTMGVDTGS